MQPIFLTQLPLWGMTAAVCSLPALGRYPGHQGFMQWPTTLGVLPRNSSESVQRLSFLSKWQWSRGPLNCHLSWAPISPTLGPRKSLAVQGFYWWVSPTNMADLVFSLSGEEADIP